MLDRLVGYKVSPLLWKKVKRGLSAGASRPRRCASLSEREREIQAFDPVEYWSIDAELAKQTGAEPQPRDIFRAGLQRVRARRPTSTPPSRRGRPGGAGRSAYRVADVTKRRYSAAHPRRSRRARFQQEASRKIGLGVRRTMQIAQELYEGVDLGPQGTQGLITYMRTDSTNVASSAQFAAREEIARRYGPEFVPEKAAGLLAQGERRSGGARGDPTDRAAPGPGEREAVPLRRQQFRLYQLIWQRFIASQMRPAILDQTGVDVAAGREEEISRPGDPPFLFRATGSVVKFPGYMAVYQAGRDEGDAADELDKGALPPLGTGEDLDLLQLLPEQHFTQPPPRFTEASLVKALEEKGIGRPSTYAPTIATIQARGYVATERRSWSPPSWG